jgi:hypothetical protein
LEIFDPDYLPNPKRVNFDLTSACWAIKKTVPIVWDTEHIKGHQDRFIPYHALSHKSKLNVEMDSTAKAYWIHLVSTSEMMPHPKVHEIQGEEWQLWNGEHKISHPADNILYSCMQDPITDMWWTREGHVPVEAAKLIDYTATADTMKQLPQPRRRYVTKTASENCGVGRTLVEWKFQTNAKCPRCAHDMETTLHVQQCQGHAADAVFQTNLSKVQAYLEDENTRPDIQDAILECIKKWRRRQPIHLRDYQEDIQEVIRQQHTIGWLDFLECLPAKGWQQLQRQYYSDQNLRKSSKRWI